MDDNIIDTPCDCPPGWCEHLGKTLIGRLHELAHMDSELGRSYRRLWWSERGKEAMHTDRNIGCRWQGDGVRAANGRLTTRECAPCAAKNQGKPAPLKVFVCQNEHRKGEQVTWTDCLACPHYHPKGMPLEEKKPEPPALLEPEVVTKTDQNSLQDVRKTHTDFLQSSDKPKRLYFINRFSPGDVLCMTAAIESLARCYPNLYELHVASPCRAIFEHNPHISGNHDISDFEQTKAALTKEDGICNIHYPLINESNQLPVHMMHGFLEYIRDSLKLPNLVMKENRPRLYLSSEEKSWIPQPHERAHFGRPTRYWVLNAGYKKDAPAKMYHRYQEVVDRLAGRVQFVQVGEESKDHFHKPLNGVLNLIGKTDLRQLIRLAYHADGILTGVSFLMHVAAAFEKPAVIVAGGREGRSWNTYPTQAYLSTVGQLACCRTGGCWRGKIVPDMSVPLEHKANESLCREPVYGVQPVGRCMTLITPEEICGQIERFYRGGVIPATYE